MNQNKIEEICLWEMMETACRLMIKFEWEIIVTQIFPIQTNK
jgi:hypothetical protein